MDARFAKMDARVAALRLISEWENAPGTMHVILTKLLGFKKWNDLREAHIAEGVDGVLSRHFRGLRGPHGRTYYRMLLVRQGGV